MCFNEVMSIFWMILILFGFLALGSRLIIGALEVLIGKLEVKGRVLMSALLVALSTSFPELFVAITAGAEGIPEISLGNLLGANVINSSLIIGLTVVFAGVIPVVGEFMRFEFIAAFLTGTAPLILMLDGSLSRLDGLVLIVIYLIYLKDLVLGWQHQHAKKSDVVHHRLISRIGKLRKQEVGGSFVKIVLGMTMLFVGSYLLVGIIEKIALQTNISQTLLGFLLVSLGTTLPELFLSFGEIVKKETALILGNLLGSVVTNSTLIAGLLVIIAPIDLVNNTPYAVANLGFVIMFFLFWFFAKSKRKLVRQEGLILIGVYLMYMGIAMLLV